MKELKPSRLASCYQTIGLYHATLMSELEVHEGVNNNLTIEHYLTPNIREQIAAMDTTKAHYVGKMNLLNQIFRDVL